jgi:hypothetical protein
MTVMWSCPHGSACAYVDLKWVGRIYRVPGGWATEVGGRARRKDAAARAKVRERAPEAEVRPC